MDNAGLASRLGWRFTRCGDGLTFSFPMGETEPDVSKLLGAIGGIVADEVFRIPSKKTRVVRGEPKLLPRVTADETLMRPRMEAAMRRAPLALAAPESSRPDDPELVRALRAGEAWAAPAVWNKHAPKVFRVAARVLGSDHDAEDLTQDVFARVFSGVDGLRDPSALGSFIFSVTLRMLKWELRRRRVRRILRLSETGRLPEYPVDAPDSEAREAIARLYSILDQLSVEERTAFVLRHMEKMSLPEIATAMGLSLATVKRRIGRATELISRADEDGTVASYGPIKKEGPHES